MDAQGLSEDNWRRLDDVWYKTQSEWRGITAEAFDSQFWSQFEQNVQDYNRALAELAEAVEAAQDAAWYAD